MRGDWRDGFARGFPRVTEGDAHTLLALPILLPLATQHHPTILSPWERAG